MPKVELVSTRAGTNNPANSRLAVEERHLIIAKQMERQFADKISSAEVNEATVAPKRGGALFGQRNAASHNFDKEKAHKYFNRIDTSYMM